MLEGLGEMKGLVGSKYDQVKCYPYMKFSKINLKIKS